MFSYQGAIRILIIISITLISVDILCAQGVIGDITYRFSVEDVNSQESAKPIQYGLLENHFVHDCRYIYRCNCFKLFTPNVLNRVQISDLLESLGARLIGTVHCSDGRDLHPPVESNDQR